VEHPLLAGAKAAAASVQLEGQPVAVLVVAVVDTGREVLLITVTGRSGVEEVYGVPYLDVWCDVACHVCWIHHFSPLITAIRREM
jgi:hypothetical protein